MKVITAQTMQEIDRTAIEKLNIPGIRLMENAGQKCVEELVREFGASGNKQAVILAGKGNNGGDGYVIARLLAQKGWGISVIVLAEREEITGDAAVNLEKLSPDLINFCPREGQLSTFHKEKIFSADVLVDALLGTGLRNDVSGVYQEAIALLNGSGRPILAVDIPSGIHGSTGRVMGGAIRASLTVTFAFAKLGHILYPGAEYTGRLVIADIGIPPDLMESASGYEFVNSDAVRPLLKHRDRQAHKGTFGHVLIVAGSPGKTGAAALAANSAVRTGSGLVSLAIPESLNRILEVKTTEAMTIPLPDSGSGYLTSSALSVIEQALRGKDALAIGPGLDRRPETAELVHNIIEVADLPLVIDADGLNALAEDVTVLRRKRSASLVLTPHPGEMARLLGVSIPDVETIRISVAQEFARNYGIYLILKGARTIIAAPDGTAAINGSGNPGMASGGMGDVLTGVIVSLLGQGYTAWDACRLGVYIHGFAADMVAEIKGESGMCAQDVQERIPYAYARLLKSNTHATTRTDTYTTSCRTKETSMQTIADIMTRNIVTVTKETTVRELAKIFEEKHFGSLPVIDGEGNLIGIVTESDLIQQVRNLHIPTVISLFDWVIPLEGERTLAKELKKVSGQTVGDIFESDVETIIPSAPVSEAADRMSSRKVTALPVVEDKKLVGIVSRIDIIRSLAK